MVIEDLYRYRVNKSEEGLIDATITINKEHALYGGHFPGFPVTPGVCQVLMVQEILERELNSPLILSGARQIKFTAVHEPDREKEVELEISFKREDKKLKVTACLYKEAKVFLKFKGEFSKRK